MGPTAADRRYGEANTYRTWPSETVGREPLVPVIIATRNRPEMLREALASVEKQSIRASIEILVIDDASGPGDAELNRKTVAEIPNATYCRLRRQSGPGVARNTGLLLATGSYIALLDDDDVAVPDRLARQVDVLDGDGSTDVVCTAVAWIDDDGEEFATFPGIIESNRWPSSSSEVLRLLLLESNKIPTTTVMGRSEVFREHSFASDLWVAEDWQLYMRMSVDNVRITALPMIGVRVRRGRRHESLMRSRIDLIHQYQRHALERTKLFAKQQGLDLPRGLWRRAYANQYSREAAQLSGSAALLRYVKSIAEDPSNSTGWRALGRRLGHAVARRR